MKIRRRLFINPSASDSLLACVWL